VLQQCDRQYPLSSCHKQLLAMNYSPILTL
jgi:hypothetical protein